MLKYFPVFKSVYETLNFSRSAQQLFVSQSTISQQIKQLETDLGVKLFIRKGKREIKPTPAADELYTSGIKIWEHVENLEQKISKMDSDYVDCHIGVSNTIAETTIASIFKAIKVPDNVNLTLKMSNSTDIVEGLNHHRYDFGFIEKPITTPGIERFAFFQDYLVHAGNFADSIWLQREAGSGVRHFTEQYWKLNNITPKQIFTIENNEMILKFLHQGMGQTITSRTVLNDEIPYQELGPKFKRDFYFLSQPTYQVEALNDLKAKIMPVLKQMKEEQHANKKLL
ncbi:LysR family transcriptional regulator [Fructilactobacillus sp. Tb1]|uniref:LysR family transcriptional regulator n=1 Tax=Fructilactobacillus sp. Tb1 TaxID=3422304 RepID=UPI003D2D515A